MIFKYKPIKVFVLSYLLVMPLFSADIIDKPESIMGIGHRAKVCPASPIKYEGSASPHKGRFVVGDTISAVRKRLFQNFGDIFEEANSQTTIRERIREIRPELLKHIPKIADITELSIKMEKASGNQLGQEFSCFKPEPFFRFMHSLMNFIKAMHEIGYAHEDLSPKNIMVDFQNFEDFCVIDYELSGRIGIDIRKSTGDYEFSDPAKIQNKIIGPEADVYSLGKIISAYKRYQDDFGDYNYDGDKVDYLIDYMTAEDIQERCSLARALSLLSEIIHMDLQNFINKHQTRIIYLKALSSNRSTTPGYDPLYAEQ